MRVGEVVFVDTSAWAALALVRDPRHPAALDAWSALDRQGARLVSSIPVLLETFTFLDRAANRAVALAWRRALEELPRFTAQPVTKSDLQVTWSWLERRELHKLSAVDASSFALMARTRIRRVFAFDHHFASAGFALVG